MKIAIIGASGAGLYLALLLSRRGNGNQIHLIDKEEAFGRKLKVTGNGRCNLGNDDYSSSKYNHPEYMEPLMAKYDVKVIESVLNELGVSITKKDGYWYPESLNSKTHTESLVSQCKEEGVIMRPSTRLLDYRASENGIDLFFENGKEHFDKVVFSTGGCSSPNHGSDGSMFKILQNHGYDIVEPYPSLTKVKTKQNVKALDGVRHKAKVTLFRNDAPIYEENGEIIFTKEGLSGICIFNCEAYIAREKAKSSYRIQIDLFPELEDEQLRAKFHAIKKVNPKGFLRAFFVESLGDYLWKRKGQGCMVDVCKRLSFDVASVDGFVSSQVTSGGVSLSSLNSNLESKLEKNVHFAGEIIDIDGLCGGYNLIWCLISSLVVEASIDEVRC